MQRKYGKTILFVCKIRSSIFFFVIFAPKMGLRRRDTQYGLICFRPCASLFKIIAFAAFSSFLPDLAINFQFSNNPLKHYLKQ